ncbi:transcription factor Rba50 [Fusarium mundagurra]|uniref:Transcription factor Rba50 n=1 Tax=Fusarium mundagurra TaxID=1567541 RepID=A0A8H6D0Z4_9HYPO|nr:transcription factor Rba50 [Fusarium mundagurra]
MTDITRKPHLLSISPNHQPYFDQLYESLLTEIQLKADFSRAKHADSAARQLSEQPSPTAVLITDESISDYRNHHLWRAVLRYVRKGGRAVVMGNFSSFLKPLTDWDHDDLDFRTPQLAAIGGRSPNLPSPSPLSSGQRPRLTQIQLDDWDPDGTYDESPPTCVHYSIEWKLQKQTYRNRIYISQHTSYSKSSSPTNRTPYNDQALTILQNRLEVTVQRWCTAATTTASVAYPSSCHRQRRPSLTERLSIVTAGQH